MHLLKQLAFNSFSNKNFKQLNEYCFIKYFFILMGFFLLYHMMVWFIWTSKIFGAEPYYVGDLARLAYQIDVIEARRSTNTLPKQHLNKDNYMGQNIDLITIGDSFSNGMSGGNNAYYQDFIASEHNLSVLNIQNIKLEYNYIETISLLLNSGWLNRVKPKAILIQSVQREMLTRFNRPIRWDLTIPEREAFNNLFNRGWIPQVPQLKCINTANYKFPYYSLLYKLSDNAFGKNKVYKFRLNKSFFTAEEADTLLVYKDDILRLTDPTLENIRVMNTNFNILARKLKKEGIKLYVMPAIDKYDLYQPFISNNKYPKNSFFDMLSPLHKDYTLVNTKEILSPLIVQGVKDVFYADDTHWGPIASKAIAKSSYFKKVNE